MSSPQPRMRPAGIHSSNVDAVINRGRSGFTGNGHSDGLGASTLAKSQILPKLSESTAVFVVTHGYSAGLYDSHGWLIDPLGNPTTGALMGWSDIEYRTEQGSANGKPKHSFVILYACDAFSTNQNLTSRFNLPSHGGVILVYAQSIFPYAGKPSDPVAPLVSLNEHTKRLLNRLEEGYAASTALQKTEQAYKAAIPRPNLPPIFVGMVLEGDPLAVLGRVYLSSHERGSYSHNGQPTGTVTRWFIVYDETYPS